MFYDPRFFPFVDLLERSWETIRAELDALPQAGFETYRDFEPWKVFIFRKGLDQRNIDHHAENCSRCPETAAIIDSIPGVTSAAFSRLLPGTHLWPHRDPGIRVRCHLGLKIVDDCSIRVGGMVRQWQEGKCLLFNASHLHESWNRNRSPRTVLLVDVKAETLSCPPERHAVPKTLAEAAAGLWLSTRYVARKSRRPLSYMRD